MTERRDRIQQPGRGWWRRGRDMQSYRVGHYGELLGGVQDGRIEIFEKTRGRYGLVRHRPAPRVAELVPHGGWVRQRKRIERPGFVDGLGVKFRDVLALVDA